MTLKIPFLPFFGALSFVFGLFGLMLLPVLGKFGFVEDEYRDVVAPFADLVVILKRVLKVNEEDLKAYFEFLLSETKSKVPKPDNMKGYKITYDDMRKIFNRLKYDIFKFETFEEVEDWVTVHWKAFLKD